MRRSRFEIMVDILSAAKEGSNKTGIVYGARLNFRQAEDYFNFLMGAELLMKNNTDKNKTIYHTTDKGVEMLERYKELIELKPQFD